VSAGRSEASCLLLRCRSFATPSVFLAWNYICDSPVADIRFSLGSTGAGGSSGFIRMHFEPGRPQRANACGLFDSGFVCAPAHEKSNDIALYCATTKRHIVEASQQSCQTSNMKLVCGIVRRALSTNWLRFPRSGQTSRYGAASRLRHSHYDGFGMSALESRAD
jgi:hypothetical protein